MHFTQREMTEHESDTFPKMPTQDFHCRICLTTVRAFKIPVLDQGDLGRFQTEDVIAVTHGDRKRYRFPTLIHRVFLFKLSPSGPGGISVSKRGAACSELLRLGYLKCRTNERPPHERTPAASANADPVGAIDQAIQYHRPMASDRSAGFHFTIRKPGIARRRHPLRIGGSRSIPDPASKLRTTFG
jgi:hypothetical protein